MKITHGQCCQIDTPKLHPYRRVHDETTYFALLDNPKAFVEFILAFILSIGLQLNHKSTCNGGGSLTRHSHYVRIRLGGLPSGAFSARDVRLFLLCCPISSCATARCDPTWPGTLCWPPTAVSVWHGARRSVISRPWPS